MKKLTTKRLARAWFIGMLVVALLADFVTNDRPLMASMEDEWRFPVLHEYGLSLGIVDEYRPVIRNWNRAKPDWAIWPVVPYSAGSPDLKNSNYHSPFGEQETGPRARHYLGTDKLGRDILAGLIRGTRVAIIVGFGAVLLSLLIGIPLGGIAGFFGNDGLTGPRYRCWGWAIGGTLGLVYGFVSLIPFFGIENMLWSIILLIACAGLFGFISSLLLRLIPAMRKQVAFPADSLVLQGVELFVNIPGLVLLIALLAIINRPSIWVVVVIIGVLRWPTVARYLRAELLRIRRLPYIDAARVSGIPKWRILFRHALPNAIGPLMIVAIFGLGGAILLEAFLSFLGIGIPVDQITWGSLLRQSRQHPGAWWLALFPGLLLTGTVLAANSLGADAGAE
ncbi:MAG: peptide/nickel transport system permease protein [Neolewinella sp.]